MSLADKETRLRYSDSALLLETIFCLVEDHENKFSLSGDQHSKGVLIFFEKLTKPSSWYVLGLL